MTLDYRSPQTGSPRAQRVIAELVQLESTSSLAVIGKITLAIPLCLLGPFLITTGVWRWGTSEGISFGFTLLLTTVVLVPILLWYARRNQGDFASDALSGMDRPSSYGEYEMNRFTIEWAIWTGFALLGPQLVWNIYDHFKGRESVDPAIRCLAAQIVIELLDAGEGVPAKQLKRSDRNPTELARALRYLRRHDWIDVSKKGDRVWLCTPFRNRLAGL